MDDYYTELLIKRKNGLREHLLALLLIIAVLTSIMSVFFIPGILGFFVPIIVIVAAYFLFRRLSVEYEYQYVNGDLDIDKIYYKTRRKHVFSMNVSELECLAPADHPKLKEYHASKVLDFTSHTDVTKEYAMILSAGTDQVEVLFEPNEEILEGLFMMTPRKVIRRGAGTSACVPH